ncbi:hypothetical protein WP12_18290 [Sphingomonas sp. SRS2]|nr:hypothetical protein WP12_18290 [Sphingomonas sp. SRS2]
MLLVIGCGGSNDAGAGGNAADTANVSGGGIEEMGPMNGGGNMTYDPAAGADGGAGNAADANMSTGAGTNTSIQ